jgi:hypothetical protein
MLMDPWAIELMIEELTNQLNGHEAVSEFAFAAMRDKLTADKQGWEKLVALDALRTSLIH